MSDLALDYHAHIGRVHIHVDQGAVKELLHAHLEHHHPGARLLVPVELPAALVLLLYLPKMWVCGTIRKNK